MLGDELDGLGGLGRLRRQDQRVGALALPPLRARLPVDLAVGMVQVGQLHRLHFVLGRRRGARGRGRGQVRRRRVVRMRRAAHARHLHHPPEPRLLRPLHEHARRQVVQEHGPDPRRHPVGTGSCGDADERVSTRAKNNARTSGLAPERKTMRGKRRVSHACGRPVGVSIGSMGEPIIGTKNLAERAAFYVRKDGRTRKRRGRRCNRTRDPSTFAVYRPLGAVKTRSKRA